MLLTQRAETAETALKEISTELNGLKGRVSQMVAAIFGKPSDFNFYVLFADPEYKPPADFVYKICAGPRSKNLSQDPLIKLKAVYTLVEQLYIGAQRALAAISPANQGPNRLSDVL